MRGSAADPCAAARPAMQLGHQHPDVVLLVAHARRCLRLGDLDGAALRLALLSELGVLQGHIGSPNSTSKVLIR